jgi:hypothetical protein
MDTKALCREVVRGCTTLLALPVNKEIAALKLELSVLAPATKLLEEHYKTLLKYPSTTQQYEGRRATAQENRYEELKEALGGLLLASYMGHAEVQADELRSLQDICGTML